MDHADRARATVTGPINLVQLAAALGGVATGSAGSPPEHPGNTDVWAECAQAVLDAALAGLVYDANFGRTPQAVAVDRLVAAAGQVLSGGASFTDRQLQEGLAIVLLQQVLAQPKGTPV